MMKNKLSWWMIIFITSLLGFVFISSVHADNNVQFSVVPELPQNQSQKDQSYFDLRMAPGQKQTIYVDLKNTAQVESQFKIRINQAYTNHAGFIDYGQSKQGVDASFPYQLSEIVHAPKTIKVAGQSSAQIPIEINMPDKEYAGQILAGIQVLKMNEKQEGGIHNEFGYIVGLKLTENDEPVTRKLELIKVKPAVSFAKTSVVAQLRNPTMDAMGHLKYQAKVIDRHSGKTVRQVKYDKNMQMAPNSTYNFAIDWAGKDLRAGKYLLDLKVQDAKDNHWHFKKNFVITAKDAKNVNRAVVGQASMPLWIGIVGVLVLLVLLGSIYWWVKKRQPR